MSRLFGILKVTLVLVFDFITVYSLLNELSIALIVVGAIGLYILFGGYLSLLKEGAISSKKLPTYQRNRFKSASVQLGADIKSTSNVDISRIKLYRDCPEEMLYGLFFLSPFWETPDKRKWKSITAADLKKLRRAVRHVRKMISKENIVMI